MILKLGFMKWIFLKLGFSSIFSVSDTGYIDDRSIIALSKSDSYKIKCQFSINFLPLFY